ncbi:MAG: tyrosine-type recombinase/integrase [Bacteriovoracia bacterium]
MNEFQVNIYPIQDGTFLTSFTHPLSKRKVRKAFTSRELAKGYKEEMEIKYRRKHRSHYQELTLEELIMIFIDEKPRNAFAKSKIHIMDFVSTFGEYQVSELTSDSFKVWLDQVQKEYKLRDITMRGLKCQVDTLFSFLVDKDIISESPLSKIYYQKYVPSVKSRNILTSSHIEDLLTSIKSYSPGYLYPMIKLISETASKNKEVVDLKWNDVNLEKGTIHFVENKAGKERTLPISEELVTLLKNKPKKTGVLFWTYYNEPFTTNKFHRLVTEFKLANLYKGDWTPLDLRHSFAVNFLSRGGDMKELQYILGHGVLSDTRRLYGESAKEMITKAITNPFE